MKPEKTSAKKDVTEKISPSTVGLAPDFDAWEFHSQQMAIEEILKTLGDSEGD